MSMAAENSTERPRLEGVRVALVGKFGGMSRRDVQKLVREHGGVAVERPETAQLIVVGEKELPLEDLLSGEGLFDDSIRRAHESGLLRIISETELWRRLGLVEESFGVRRLYTTAMLADLLKVPVAVVRRWHRRGLIVPAREVRRLAYFDFQEVATARSLARLLSAGISPATLERKLAELSRFLPGAERRLAQLSVIVEGKEILLRQGDGLIDAGGQLRFDFEGEVGGRKAGVGICGYEPQTDIRDDGAAIGALSTSATPEETEQLAAVTLEELTAQAAELEDEGRLDEALEYYRAALAAGGGSAELHFRLAELLYRTGDIHAARERYYMAIELDEDLVEARANLGCVLSELGERDLAVAAFTGALKFHPDYADAHYHLARTLDELDRPVEAEQHWRVFLALAAEGPWADEARARLDSSDPADL